MVGVSGDEHGVLGGEVGNEGIFLKLGENLTLLQQTPYDSEAFLQEALADHPEVIAGPTTQGDRESRLLLVKREMGVPSSPQSGSTFSLRPPQVVTKRPCEQGLFFASYRRECVEVVID